MSDEETQEELTSTEEFIPMNITITVNITLDDSDGSPMVTARTRLNGQPVDFPFVMVAGGGAKPIRIEPVGISPQMTAGYTTALHTIIENMMVRTWFEEKSTDGN